MNREKLRGLIFTKYKSIQAFADDIKWQRNKASRVVNGIQEPDSDDMRAIADLFDLSSDEFIDIFLASSSQSEYREVRM